MRKTSRLLLLALLLPAATASAQPQQQLDAAPSGPTSPPVLDRQPSTSSQLPRTEMPADRAAPPAGGQGSGAQPAAPSVGGPAESGGRTAPPPGHQTIPPPAPLATGEPPPSEGAGQLDRSPIPDHPGARPDASTTDAPRR
jgi:hypothetical protein